MTRANSWKLHDAKAQLSEPVRRARSGDHQIVTVHGKDVVVVSDVEKVEVKARTTNPRTMKDFINGSKKYRGLGLKIPARTKMVFRDEPVFGDDEA